MPKTVLVFMLAFGLHAQRPNDCAGVLNDRTRLALKAVLARWYDSNREAAPEVTFVTHSDLKELSIFKFQLRTPKGFEAYIVAVDEHDLATIEIEQNFQSTDVDKEI